MIGRKEMSTENCRTYPQNPPQIVFRATPDDPGADLGKDPIAVGERETSSSGGVLLGFHMEKHPSWRAPEKRHAHLSLVSAKTQP